MRLFRHMLRAIVAPTATILLLTMLLAVLWQLARVAGVAAMALQDGWALVRLLGYLMPAVLQAAVPAALLMGVGLGYDRMRADNELLATRAAGASLWRLLAPALALATASAALLTFVNVDWYPRAVQGFKADMTALALRGFEAELSEDELSPLASRGELWVGKRTKEGARSVLSPAVLVLDDANTAGAHQLFFFDALTLDGDLDTRAIDLHAPSSTAVLLSENQVVHTEMGRTAFHVDLDRWLFSQTAAFHHFHQHGVPQLWSAWRKLPKPDRLRARFFLFEKFGMPLQCLGFALIAAALALSDRQKPGMIWALLVLAFVGAYALHQMFRGMALSRQIPPEVAPFAAAAVLISIGTVVLWRARTA